MAELKSVKGPYLTEDNTIYALDEKGLNSFWATVYTQGLAPEQRKATTNLLAASWEMYRVLDYALAALKHCFHAHDSGVDGICLEIEAVMAEARGEAT